MLLPVLVFLIGIHQVVGLSLLYKGGAKPGCTLSCLGAGDSCASNCCKAYSTIPKDAFKLFICFKSGQTMKANLLDARKHDTLSNEYKHNKLSTRLPIV